MKRPLGLVIIAYLLGILLGDALTLPVGLWLAAGLGVAALCLCIDRFRPWLLLPLLLLSGAANLALNQQTISPLDLRRTLGDEPALVTVRGRVETADLRASTPRAGEEALRTNARLRVEAVQMNGAWQPVHGWVLASSRVGEDPLLQVGQQVEVFGLSRVPPPAFARGMFDYRAHLARRGIFHQLEFEGPADVRVLSDVATPLTVRFRAWAMAALQRGLPPDDTAVDLLWAMTLGWRTALTDDVSEPFMRSGTMHLFAISGLHIGLIAGILVALLRLARVPREWVGLLVIPLLWFFTAVTGWQPSAVRATIMMSVIVLGWSLRRPVDLLNSLAAAAFLILLYDPRQVFHAGFQLSFAVVASIALLLPPLERVRQRLMRSDPLLPPELRPRWQRILDGPARFVTLSLAVSTAAWLGSLPLIMHHFHLVTPVGLLANLLVVQLGSLALASALGSLLSAPLVPLFSDLFNHSAWFFTHAMVASSQWFSELPFAWRYVKAPPLISALCYYGALWVMVSGWWLRRRRAGSLLLLLLAALAVGAWQREHAHTRLTVLPLAGGHALFFEQPGAATWLIDCGDERNWRFRVRPFLQAQGVNRLDNFVLTHGDVRHVGAATNVLNEFSPRRIVLNPVSQRSPPYRHFERALAEREITALRPAAGDLVPPWTVRHPAREDRFSRADDSSLVMALELADARILHVPDLEATGWRLLLERHPGLSAEVVIASPVGGGKALIEGLANLPLPRHLLVVDAEFPADERLSAEGRMRLKRLDETTRFTSEAGAVELRFHHAGGWRMDAASEP
jgi:competence protein ComEC